MIPPIQFTEIGMVPPTREEVTAGLQEIFLQAFGSSLNLDSRTPQGQLITSLTAMIQDRDNASVELGNNFDPRYSKFLFQEALAAIYFLKRQTETRSVALLEFIGIAGTAIPQGYLVVDDAGYEWEVTTSTVLSSELVSASCTTPGPIEAAPLTIHIPKQAIDGIDRVENPDAAAAGSLAESRANFEDRRYESVSANAKLTNEAVRGAVGNIAGVIDVFVEDNPTDATVLIGETDFEMTRNSLLVSVVGGDDQALAEQILIKGGTGCTFMGNTTVVWKDLNTNAVEPPEYTVKFERPAHITTYLRLTVVNPSSISYANSEAAKAQIVTAFQSGTDRARIGGLVIGSNYICGLDSALIRPVKLDISTDEVTWLEYKRFGVDEFPVTSTANVTLVGI